MDAAIENDFLRVSIDPRGNLASLVNKATGCEYLVRGGLDFWQMFYSSPEDPETQIQPAGQRGVQIECRDRTIVVTYPQLEDVLGRRLDVSLSYTLSAGGEELSLAASIDNRSEFVMNELWLPCVGGLGSLGDDPETAFLLYPESAGRRIVNPVANLADRGAQPVRGEKFHCLRDLYPGRASMQWMGLYGQRGSLYVGSHDASLQTTATNAMLHLGGSAGKDCLSLGFIKYPFCGPGQSWQGEPFVLAVHNRPWRDDARRYRRFADTYQDHGRTKPQWVRRMPGMHDIVLLHQHGRVRLRYDQIDQLCGAAAAGGIDVLKLTGWSHGGHDNHYPDFLPSDRLGGEQSLVDNLRQARQKGFRTVLYFHFIQMSPNSDFYKRHGEFCAIKGPSGFPFIDVFTWPSHGSMLALNERFQLINACVGAEPWREQILQCVQRGLAMGADCVFLDQTAGGPSSFLCFDKRHGHKSPALACGPGKTAVSAEARKLIDAHGGDAALGAEYISDVILQYYDFTIPFGMGFFHGGQHFGEMYRFTFPEDVLLTQYMSREDYQQLHYSFVMGYRFFLAPGQQCDLLTDLDAKFVQRLASLVGLYRRHGDILLEGRFLDTEPLAIGNRALVARAYQSPAGAAAAVWNPTDQGQRLAIDWPGRTPTAIHTPAGAVASPGQAYVLAPDDVAVMLFE